MFQIAKRETKPYRLFFKKFKNDWSMVFAAMLAFNLLIALLPIAVTLFGILGLVIGNNTNLQEKIKEKIINSFPNVTKEGLRQIIDLAFNQLYRDAGIILGLGILFAIFGSSRLFIAIDRSMTIIYRLEERKTLKQNLLALGMLFLFILLILLMIGASSAPSFLLNIIPNAGGRFLSYIVGLLTGLVVSFILFEVIYFIVPNKKMTFKETWCGSLLAAIALQIFMILFPLYVRKFMTNYAGQIGFAIILLLFFYYFAVILILGAQINSFFFEKFRAFPDGLGTFVSKLSEVYTSGEAGHALNRRAIDDPYV
ncbi:unnamed protein product [Didymodactylos carnosus]|uniref:Uncharacterized protein n=1 Tax=Didymodactylos carnosus TaxID=1234261 RepID=A0A814IFQ5_9BILA|nr:unnamed protein product [Didymodactylos carnosus]CAF3795097.1 unnamed protein product [Didymodactylos carnosus]